MVVVDCGCSGDMPPLLTFAPTLLLPPNAPAPTCQQQLPACDSAGWLITGRWTATGTGPPTCPIYAQPSLTCPTFAVVVRCSLCLITLTRMATLLATFTTATFCTPAPLPLPCLVADVVDSGGPSPSPCAPHPALPFIPSSQTLPVSPFQQRGWMGPCLALPG